MAEPEAPAYRVEFNWRTPGDDQAVWGVHHNFPSLELAQEFFDAFEPAGAFTVTERPSTGGVAEKRGDGKVMRLFELA